MSSNDKAFPMATDPNSTYWQPGLTKREYFALHLMAGHLAGDGAFCAGAEDGDGALDTPEIAARKAVEYADALITELEDQI
jgi:hypothetical protein